MNQNFFSNPGIQQVLKKSNKIIAAYNNKHGSFLIYPLFRNYTIIYACQKQTKKNKPYIQKLAKRHNSIYTVIETLNQIEHFEKKSFKEFIPRATRQISLSQSQSEILSNMHSKGRYNANLAEKKGLKVTDDFSINDFYYLLEKTADRDGFATNNKDYYQELFKFAPQIKLRKYGVKHENTLIAAALTIDHKNTTYYFYGCSDHKYRNLMAPYLIQKTAIFDAQKHGAQTYDFLGISPYSPHPLDKVSEFKRKFGGYTINYSQNKIVVHKKLLFLLLKLRKVLKSLTK